MSPSLPGEVVDFERNSLFFVWEGKSDGGDGIFKDSLVHSNSGVGRLHANLCENWTFTFHSVKINRMPLPCFRVHCVLVPLYRASKYNHRHMKDWNFMLLTFSCRQNWKCAKARKKKGRGSKTAGFFETRGYPCFQKRVEKYGDVNIGFHTSTRTAT